MELDDGWGQWVALLLVVWHQQEVFLQQVCCSGGVCCCRLWLKVGRLVLLGIGCLVLPIAMAGMVELGVVVVRLLPDPVAPSIFHRCFPATSVAICDCCGWDSDYSTLECSGTIHRGCAAAEEWLRRCGVVVGRMWWCDFVVVFHWSRLKLRREVLM